MKFDQVILIQSYPCILDVKNYIDSTEYKVLVISLLDKNIQKFLKIDCKPNIDYLHFGNYIFFRKRLFKFIVPIYIYYIFRKIPSVNCDKLIITYRNWCDFGALPLVKITSTTQETWVSFCEDRYEVVANSNLSFPVYVKIINHLTHNLVEHKIYQSYVNNKKVLLHGFGLKNYNRKIINLSNTDVSGIPDISLHKKNYSLFIDRELFRSSHCSLKNFIGLCFTIKLFSINNNIDICVKFKPRNFCILRFLIYKFLGFKVLPTYLPVQLFCKDNLCNIILAFNTSAISYDFAKPIILLSSLPNYYLKSFDGNIESLKQRSSSTVINSFIYLNSLEDLKNYKIM